jgi:SAM-dependent methyltransferase
MTQQALRPDAVFMRIVDAIQARNPLQRKMIASVLARPDAVFWQRVASFSEHFEKLLDKHGIAVEKVADCYNKLCKDMLLEQIKFRKTGRYSSSSFAEVAQRVYHSEKEMEAMVYGLAMSQFLWRNHYGLFDYFIDTIGQLEAEGKVRNYLEIGPGHGLHLAESLRTFSKAHFDVVDISAISLGLSQRVVAEFAPGHDVTFHLKDVREFVGGSSYDLVVINEVIEHLEDPLAMMQTIAGLIGDTGHVFLTTCANAPSVDHIWLYDSVEAMRGHIAEAGLEIIHEKVLPVEDHIPREEWAERKVEINYGALCRRAGAKHV